MNTIAIGHNALGCDVELRDYGKVGYKYTPMGHAPSADDERFRYVIFRSGNCNYASDDYDEALYYLKLWTVDSRWYGGHGDLKFVDKEI